jgi:hypothetical protein
MGSARDSAPDPNHTSSMARSPVPVRLRSRPPSAPASASPRQSSRAILPVAAVSGSGPPLAQQPKLLARLRDALRSRHDSPRTEHTDCHWVKRFSFFHDVRHPAEMIEPEINAFLTHLAVQEQVSASMQNQALSALLFLYRHILGRQIGDLGEVVRARRPTRLPVVLTRAEVKAFLGHLTGDKS